MERKVPFYRTAAVADPGEWEGKESPPGRSAPRSGAVRTVGKIGYCTERKAVTWELDSSGRISLGLG